MPVVGQSADVSNPESGILMEDALALWEARAPIIAANWSHHQDSSSGDTIIVISHAFTSAPDYLAALISLAMQHVVSCN